MKRAVEVISLKKGVARKTLNFWGCFDFFFLSLILIFDFFIFIFDNFRVTRM